MKSSEESQIYTLGILFWEFYFGNSKSGILFWEIGSRSDRDRIRIQIGILGLHDNTYFFFDT